MLVAGVELLLVASSGPGWLALGLPVAFGLAFERSVSRSGSGRGVARKRRADHLHQECPSVTFDRRQPFGGSNRRIGARRGGGDWMTRHQQVAVLEAMAKTSSGTGNRWRG